MATKFSATLVQSSIPILLLLSSAAIFTLALHIANHKLRLMYFSLLLWLVYMSAQKAKENFGLYTPLASVWSIYLLNYVLHIVSLLFLEHYTASGPSQGKPQRLRQPGALVTNKIWYNPRRAGSNVSGHMHPQSQTQSVTSRYCLFFIQNFSKLAVLCFVHFKVLPLFFDETIVEIEPDDVGVKQRQLLRRLSEITARELVVRAHVASYWIWDGFFFFDGAHTFLACLFVAVGVDSPEDWPPLFGLPSEASGLRRFWSHFWHRLLVPTYKSYGDAVVQHLGWNSRSVAAKTTVAMTIFGLSGLVHGAVARFHEAPGWGWNIWWFWLNFVACLGETAVIALVRQIAAKAGLSRELRIITSGWIGQCLGYAWVATFFFWSVPKWKYPDMYPMAVETGKMNRLIASFRVG